MIDYTITDEFGYDEDYSYLECLFKSATKILGCEGIFSITFIGD